MPERVPRVAVVGHVEWVDFGTVTAVPLQGAVAHATDVFAEPAGGGGVAAVQLARLAGSSLLVTALGDDRIGALARSRLAQLGVDVRSPARAEPTRRALALLDAQGERTITTLGERLQPRGSDRELDAIAGCDGVYFTAGDVAALRSARTHARVLVATPRALLALGHGVTLDAMVLSAGDEDERREAERTAGDAELLVITEGADGGSYRTRSGTVGRWRASEPPGPVGDAFGCGDSFAAGLTFALAAGMDTDSALELAARCGAMCLTGRGPYERQLAAADL